MKNWTKRFLALLCSLAMVISGLFISAPEAKAADTEPAMVTLDGFETVTISDFAMNGVRMPEGTYKDIGTGGTLKAYSLADGSNLDGKLLSMKVKITGGSGNARFDVAGAGSWSGFSVYASANANYMHIYTNYGWVSSAQGFDIPASIAELASVLDTEFILQMSIKYIDGDTDSVEVGVYINGVLCNTCVITGIDPANFGGYLGIYCEGTGQSVTVSSVGDGVVETKPVELEGFQTLSVGDFVDDSGNKMAAGEYEGVSTGAHDVFKAKDLTNFDNKLLSMKILYEGGSYTHSLIFGGNGGWCGLNLHPNNDGTALFIDSTWAGNLVDQSTYAVPTIYADIAGVTSFINNEFILQMSMEYGEADADNKADLTIGVYINGQLYNNEKFVIPGCNMANAGNVIALYRQVDGSSIIVNSVKDPILPDESFEKITFANYGIVDNKYPYVSGDVAVQGGMGKENLDKTLTCGKILVEGSDASQIIWGGTSAWDGLRMFPTSSGNMNLIWYVGSNGTNLGTLYSNVAGVDFIGEEYDIMLSAELVDNGGDGVVNDIKIGIWFNGVLYNQEFIIAADLGDYFGNYFSVYCGKETDAVTLTSAPELIKKPSEDLAKVTFLHYGIQDGTYDHTNVSGTYEEVESANASILCGDISLNGSGETDLMWGFTNNAWHGIRLTKYQDSKELKLIYQTPEAYTEPLTIKPGVAGVDFNNNTFNLVWSVELVDNDGDGNTNDLKVGLWFDGALYLNQYCYIKDYALTIGNKFETYCAEGSSITLTSDEEIAATVPVKHNKIHFAAVEPGCHSLGNIEYWYCPDCDGFWQDEACTQLTNSKNVVLPATGSENVVHFEAKEPACHYNGNIEYWYCPDCDGFWQDEACTQLTNSKNVVLPATGSDNVQHVEAKEPTCNELGNVEYWHCPDCEQFWTDESCTALTNALSIKLPMTEHNIIHVEAIEPDCHYNGRIEHWYCTICRTFWADEACTQFTNALSVILPATKDGELVHVEAKEPTCKEEGNIEYWYCKDCLQFWQNEALTQLTNAMNVKLGTVDHKAETLPAVEAQVGKTGLTEGSKCSVCGDILVAQKTIAAKKLAAPKASKVTKATGGKKKITVKFKKVSGVTRYEIQIATKKNMKKGLKTYKVTKSKDMKNAKYVVKKLKAKTTYYVRIRTVKTVNGVTKTSAWSKAVKASKTK